MRSKKQTNKQRIEDRIRKETDINNAINKPRNSKKYLYQKYHRHFTKGKNENLIKVRTYLAVKYSSGLSKDIIKRWADHNDIKLEISKEWLNNICQNIVDNWDEFIEFVGDVKPTNLQMIVSETRKRSRTQHPMRRLRKYLEKKLKVEVPKLGKGNAIDYNKVADIIVENGIEEYFKYVKKIDNVKMKRLSKAQLRKQKLNNLGI